MELCRRLLKILINVSFLILVFVVGVIQFAAISAKTNTPLPISHHEMVYDIKNNQMILFGGEIEGGSLNDLEATWIFSSINQSWTKLSSENSPGARSNHQMVYNSITGKILLYGGISAATGKIVNDTWEFDPTTNQWTELHPITAPSARAAHEMYFDPEYNEVILYAGAQPPASISMEMWAYNFTTNNWCEINHTNSPGFGYGHSFVYDEIKKVGVFFGGRFGDGTLKNDVWFFNRSSITWTKMEPSIKPIIRYHAAMIFNPIEKNFLMFGGDNENTLERALNDTWIYNSQSNEWTEVETNICPPACCKHEMVYDHYLNKTILFGGIGKAFSVSYNELWFFDSNTLTWSQNTTKAASPIYLWIFLASFVSIVALTRLMKSSKV